jgi:polysaccharide biosynthesis protein PslH
VNLIRQLHARGWRVSLFSLLIGAEPPADELAALEDVCEQIERAPFAVQAPGRYLRVLGEIAAGRAFHRRFFYDRRAARRAAAWIEGGHFDAVVADQLYMYPYVPEHCRTVTVLDAHNVESQRVASIAHAVPFSPRGVVARLQVGAVQAYEADAVRRVARVAAVSPEEAHHFEALAPGRVDLVPNGVDCAQIRAHPDPGTRGVLFLGSLDYSANVDAVAYLAREILPRMRATDAEVIVVGSNPPSGLKRIVREAPFPISLVGFVHDVEPVFRQARLLAVPLRMGGGTRLKILEALARGTPVVSTSLGCAGLGLEPGRHLLVADEPAEFAGCVDRLLEDDDLCRQLAAEGRAAVERSYDWRDIGATFDRVLTLAADSRGENRG